ncbi:potassium voltage-gated channel subfamily G member 2 isoform X1 [Mesocricetus auratus]|uniref:Potassium voltage-gated channel subfamily G member 2 isoform X1 n=1 Tax=Mesocricetus auratus TaxID=10036 RepID=A0ABM2YIK4_MESAU|nr:potassium voltage-gated channel subfamily G member 2 isoform X1 [Mesocricetus auratus]XP_040613706.1 potassium voltage-gated channel subfamily G member 2 isoform X1 [Mesocricetus auratus]XP_040613708.1 potassium voltage-gated channel subfamily G member 2 isoform X1 [Mesocricetus auratus]XP_040613709.1 potassium voltage-gated channel subfamily G member 2 isoform X1 [Mesocricetus auratus]XP_040613710.1 potassium voltage-gated channel subfamily G member 2 isoform X1 [Mesocricetus auratus]XP_04
MARLPGNPEVPGPELGSTGRGGRGGRAARARHVIINVGGCRVRLAWAALARCPLARLERLRACRGHDELLRVCDDYDVSRDEFFFDRSPCAFRAIVALLRAGKLRLLRGPCALAFRDELAYWGIDEARLERCCLRRLRRREEEAAEACSGPPSRGPQGSPVRALGTGRLERSRRRLRDVVENPHSGLAGKLFAYISVAFVAVTAVGLCLSTMPDIRAEEERPPVCTNCRTLSSPPNRISSLLGAHNLVILQVSFATWGDIFSDCSLLAKQNCGAYKGECSTKCRNLFVLETVCVAWFSFEFLLRSLQAESKCAFLRTPLAIIDILAILPFYVSLLAGLASGPTGSKMLERAGLVLRLLRALRVLYVMRLARHSLGLRSLGLTVRRCAREFGLLLLFLCVAMALFAPLVHLAERELGARRDFSSVPASYWWAVISMTTVGYGDMVPRSLPGQVVALSSILSGILLMAFPVTSIFHTFSRSYSELKEQQQRAASPEPVLREDSTHDDSMRSASATEDSSQDPESAGAAGSLPGLVGP